MPQQARFASMHNKGLYAIITTFLFVVISVVVVIGLIYYGLKFSIFEKSFDKKLDKYGLVEDLKNKLFYCYGTNVQTNKLNGSCNIPAGVTQFAGYQFERFSYGNCTHHVWNFTISDYTDKFVYFIPVTNESVHRTCPGQLSIFIKED